MTKLYKDPTDTELKLLTEIEELKNDVERHMKIANEHVNENEKLKAELSELTHGIPIEKAKECGDYYCLDLGYCVATYFENGKWYYSDDGPNRNPCEVSNRLYPIPSTETQMEGEL